MQVPKLSGRTVRDAKFTLEQRNLMVGEIVKKFSNEYDDDVVITQIVQPGSLVKRNTKIDLIVSNGQRIGDLIVPDLVGKTLTEAKKILVDGKLKLGKVTYQTSDQKPGRIVDQYPKKGKSAKETTEVDVFVSKEKMPDEFEFEEEETGIDGNIEEDIEPDNSNKPTPDVEEPKDKKEKDTEDKDDSKSDNL
jgi:serine/threonine-protein kinase